MVDRLSATGNPGGYFVGSEPLQCPVPRSAGSTAKHNILYREIDIKHTPGAAQEIIMRTGKRAIPQFVVDGHWVQPYRAGEGFLCEEMSKLLGITEHV